MAPRTLPSLAHALAVAPGADAALVALGEALLDPDVEAVVIGISDAADDEERGQMKLIWPLVVSLASMRDDLAVVACGAFSERPEAIGDERLFALPAPERTPAGALSSLRDAARQVGQHLAWRGAAILDAHDAFRTSVASLAALLACYVEGLEVGGSSSSRTLAGPDREARHRVAAVGAVLRQTATDGE
ncbi:MAG TPA: hypothetical protein VFY16_04545, partial [Gemmatimonadaceae bacterium]|nr:hypothetical protein [Gemmatimonadaceae bacterium]